MITLNYLMATLTILKISINQGIFSYSRKTLVFYLHDGAICEISYETLAQDYLSLRGQKIVILQQPYTYSCGSETRCES